MSQYYANSNSFIQTLQLYLSKGRFDLEVQCSKLKRQHLIQELQERFLAFSFCHLSFFPIYVGNG
jgi:hypothetical protein